MKKYYDGQTLLSMKDINGNIPEIYICTSNRTAGKTTYFNSRAFKRWLKYGEKFALLYRYNYELDDVAEKYFKDIKGLFFPNYNVTSERKAKGIYHVLNCEYPDSTEENPHIEQCGYAITLNSADQLKKYSHLFSDVSCIIFDEFQSETSHYCSNEVKKFQSIHTTIARGQGEQSRRVPVIMISNPVSVINPYYVAFGVSNRLMHNTKFLRGNGWVLEQGHNESAEKAIKQSAFMSAFQNDAYSKFASEGRYLNDYNAFIKRMPESGNYLCTLKFNNRFYSIKEYASEGVMYVSDSYDDTYPFKIAIDLNDHEINYVLLQHNDALIMRLKELFEHGYVRFKNQLCKDAFLALVSYKYLVQ